MSSNWITDRPPTEADGNEEGSVIVRRMPEKDFGAPVHWSHVGAGVPWRRSVFWKPPAQAAEPAPNPPLALGQKWRRRDGKVVTITSFEGYPFWAHGVWYSPEGRHANLVALPHLELVELVSEAPKTTQQLEPRRFVSISRTALSTGQEIVDAIDDDGVAWELAGEEWRRIKPLPPREVSAAD